MKQRRSHARHWFEQCCEVNIAECAECSDEDLIEDITETDDGFFFERCARGYGQRTPGILLGLVQPQFERFAESARWAKAGAQLTFTQDLSSRLQIKNKDGDRMIQIQNGRLHFNWLGQAGGPYPRYGNVRDGFVWALQRFLEFTAQEDVGEFRPNQWEITYLNHIPKGTVWNVPNDWGFVRPLGGGPND